MIVAYPFSLQDEELALKNARWMNELGGCHGHEVLVCYDARCNPVVVEEIGAEMLKSFDRVFRLEAQATIDGWPEGANYMFRMVTGWMQSKPYQYFLWLEPDAIPLVPVWLDALDEAYERCGKKFMGDRVQVEDIPLHMSGVGIYPNPLHAFAGEAYRAHDTAWDMAAKDQIVPQAHFTKLIVHAWKHPAFKDPHELETQIRKEAVLFHSSKDGSLIDLLQSERGRKHSVQTSIAKPPKEPEEPGSPSPITCDIFIRTYPGDYPWLKYCVKSILKFCTGFRKAWIVSSSVPPDPWDFPREGWEWKQVNDETPDGYLAQQITKLYADVITDYQADYILHVDSDVIFTRPCQPENFFYQSNVIWPFTLYAEIQTPWQPITEKFMQEKVAYEFMRRFPIMVPRWLYPRLREFCYERHKVSLGDYIKNQPLREFSEFNALGAYAHKFHRDKFHWIDTMLYPLEPPFAKQFHSWGGITPDIKKELEQILNGGDAACGLQEIRTVKSDGAEKVQPSSAPPAGIKELPNGIWVLENDTHISKWVEQEGRLDHDQNTLPEILKHIKEGDTAIDAGAFIGDHTIAYMNKVGRKGNVIAFEPNPLALRCLFHNIPNVTAYDVALGEGSNMAPLSGNNNNSGGCYLGEHMKIANVLVRSLDSYNLAPDFIKLDVEGCEFKALKGAVRTIEKHRPTMVIEMNTVALGRQGDKIEDIVDFLSIRGYSMKILQENCNHSSPMYDLLCLPVPVEEKEPAGALLGASAPPQDSSASIGFHINAIVDYAKKGKDQRKYVRRLMRKHGIIPMAQKQNQ
jgi:FkbM family methyltransferase